MVENWRDMYNILHPMMDYAIANARRLDVEDNGKLPSQSTPGTKVCKLIEVLKSYLSK